MGRKPQTVGELINAINQEHKVDSARRYLVYHELEQKLLGAIRRLAPKNEIVAIVRESCAQLDAYGMLTIGERELTLAMANDALAEIAARRAYNAR